MLSLLGLAALVSVGFTLIVTLYVTLPGVGAFVLFGVTLIVPVNVTVTVTFHVMLSLVWWGSV